MFYKIKKLLKNPKKYFNLLKNPLGAITLYLSRSYLYKKLDKKYNNNPFKETINTEGLHLLLEQNKFNINKKVISLNTFLKDEKIAIWTNNKNTLKLSNLFNHFGSDKARNHNYHLIYQPILDQLLAKDEKVTISEIGLGTNNIDTLSNMGLLGSPGASARGFKEYNSNINIIGGDVDKRILFEEERIKTYFVDQLNLSSLENFLSFSDNLNLIIDDGLHTNQSNINFLAMALKLHGNQKGKWILIEDIDMKYIKTWELTSSFLSSKYSTWLIKTKISLVFVLLT